MEKAVLSTTARAKAKAKSKDAEKGKAEKAAAGGRGADAGFRVRGQIQGRALSPRLCWLSGLGSYAARGDLFRRRPCEGF